MIAIYANWTGDLLATGPTLEAAREKLTALDCEPGTPFGGEVDELTALDCGDGLRPYDAHAGGGWQDYHLRFARKRFARVTAP